MHAHPVRALASIMAISLAPAPPAHSQDPATSADSFRFTPATALVLTPSQFPQKVVIRSHRAALQTVQLRFYPLDTVSAPAIVVDSSQGTIPELGTRTWTLNRGDLSGVQWPREGYLVAYTTKHADSLRVTIHPHSVPVRLSAPPLDSFYTEVRRWTVLPGLWKCDQARGILIGTCRRSVVLPVATARSAPPGTEANEVIGFVANDSVWRGTGVVVVERRDTMPGGAIGDRIRIAGLGGAGTYDGQVRIAPDHQITLLVLVTYGLLPALLAITAGILLAMALQRYAGRDRVLMLTHARILRVAVNAAGADAEFRAALGNHPVGRQYTITEPARRERAGLLARLRQLAANNAAINPASDEYKAILTHLETPEKAVATWPLAGRALRRVADALARIAASPGPPPAPGHVRPRVVEDAAVLFAGREVELKDVETEHARLKGWADFAEQWSDLNSIAAQYTSRAQDLRDRGVPGADAPLNELKAIWRALWEEDFTTNPADSLRTLRSTVRGLEIAHPPPAPQMAGAERVDEPDPLARAAYTEASARVPDPAVIERRVRVLDASLSILATLVAILTALNLEYFDGPVFGTARDYLAAFLWAFGVKTGLEVLKVFGERVFLGLPFRAA